MKRLLAALALALFATSAPALFLVKLPTVEFVDTITDQSANANWGTDVGWSNYNMVYKIPASLISTSGVQAKITLRHSPTAGAETYDGVTICEQAAAGDAYDCAGTPSRFLFSGSSTAALGSTANAELQSDALTVTIDESKSYLVKLHVLSGSGGNVAELTAANAGSTGARLSYKIGTDETGTANVATYTSESATYNDQRMVVADLKVAAQAVSPCSINDPGSTGFLCFFGTSDTVAQQSARGGEFADSITRRNDENPSDLGTCGGSPTISWLSAGANYGLPFEHEMFYLRGGTDNRTNGRCYADYFYTNYGQPNGWALAEQHQDNWTPMAMCKLGISTPNVTSGQWCTALRDSADWGGFVFNSGDWETNGACAGGRVWARGLKSVMFARWLGQTSNDGYNFVTMSAAMVDKLIANQHADGYWFMTGDCGGGVHNGTSQLYMQAMIARGLALYYDNFDQRSDILTALYKFHDWAWSSALWQGGGTTNLSHFYQHKYNVPDGFEGDNDNSDLNGQFLPYMGWLYRKFCDPTIKDRGNAFLQAWNDNVGDVSALPKHFTEQWAYSWKWSWDQAQSCTLTNKPYITAGPTYDDVTPTNGQTLTVSDGTWAQCGGGFGTCTYEYRHLRYQTGTSLTNSKIDYVAGATTNQVTAASTGRYIGNVRACNNNGCGLWAPTIPWTGVTP